MNDEQVKHLQELLMQQFITMNAAIEEMRKDVKSVIKEENKKAAIYKKKG